MSYYERWLAGLSELLMRHGFLSADQLATGKAAPSTDRLTPALRADAAPGFIARGFPASPEPSSQGAITWDELVGRRDEYEDAYRRTPHGVPVSLCRLAE